MPVIMRIFTETFFKTTYLQYVTPIAPVFFVSLVAND